jgi:hypothetical protein
MWISHSHQDSNRRSIRASPFEPLVHKRKFSGTISPLHMDQSSYTKPVLTLSSSLGEDESTPPPPIAEIRIPIPHDSGCPLPLDNDNEDNDSDDNSTYGSGSSQQVQHPAEPDYESLYLAAQHELVHSHRQVDALVVQNRHLHRQLIEMQRHMFEYRRSRLPCTWSVPPFPRSTPSLSSSRLMSTPNGVEQRAMPRRQVSKEECGSPSPTIAAAGGTETATLKETSLN